MRVRKVLRRWGAGTAGLVLAAAAQAQGAKTAPLVARSPFSPPPTAVSPGMVSVSLAAAERAHDLGFLSTAANLYRQLLDTAEADKTPLILALATVLLDEGEAAEAEKLLSSLSGPPSAAWRLRMGLAALQLRKRDTAQAQWDAIKADEVSEADRPWYYYFTGALYDTATPRDQKRANDFYVLAERGAPTELARARFQLAAERVRLRESAPPDKDSLEVVRKLFDQAQGREWSYEPARQYAVMLALLDRKDEAVQFLRQQVLLGMPQQERGWRDEFNFLIGLLGDRSRSGVGRNALTQLVATGSKPQRQRQALQLLADASQKEPERGHFRTELTRLINATPAHPLRESLLYFRAQLALGEKDYATAEEAANRLVRDFPASPLRQHAFGILTQSAWEQRRYGLAARNAHNAREALAPANAANASAVPSAARLDLGVLEAEAWFRLGDFRNAADAYEAVLRERPATLAADRVSGLIFQRILAEIRAGSPNASAVLDQFASDPTFQLDDRWHAEWSLARALQLQGKIDEAYARVGRLLGAQSAEAPARLATLQPELRTRMAWLHAKLAFDADRFEETLAHVDELLKAPREINPALRSEIASTAVLLRAQAEFKLNREPVALATLKRLREEFPTTDAAVHSYLIESDYYAQQEKISEAQLRLTSLTDNPAYAKNENVPYALFQLALLSEKLGQEKDFEEANKRIEQLVNMEAAAREVDLIFAARLKQGDLLRRLAQFPQAQRAYEYLVNNYAQRPDVVLAQLALADCHNAQSSADASHADSAQLIFEQLRDRVDAPADVRVEAGYKLGLLLVRRGQVARAVDVWWKDVVTEFLLKNQQPFAVEDKRPYWLVRTLLDLGKLYEDQRKLEEARNAYQLVVDTKLGVGEGLARDGLKRLGVPEAKL